MENLWKFQVSKPDDRTPKEILKEQAELLPSLTGDMVYASVVDSSVAYSPKDEIDQFAFKFSIKSKFLPNYQFRVLTVCHDIPFYPAKITLDEEISHELQYEKTTIQVENEEEFISLLRKVLSSERLGVVISSIIQLSK